MRSWIDTTNVAGLKGLIAHLDSGAGYPDAHGNLHLSFPFAHPTQDGRWGMVLNDTGVTLLVVLVNALQAKVATGSATDAERAILSLSVIGDLDSSWIPPDGPLRALPIFQYP